MEDSRKQYRFWVFVTLVIIGVVASCTAMIWVGNDIKPGVAEMTRHRIDDALDQSRLTDADRQMIRGQLNRLVAAFERDQIGYAPVGEYLKRFATSDILRIGLLRCWQDKLRGAPALDDPLHDRAITATQQYVATVMQGKDSPEVGRALAEAWALHGEKYVIRADFVAEQIERFEQAQAKQDQVDTADTMSYETYVEMQIDQFLLSR